MKIVNMNVKSFESLEKIHAYLKESFGFSSYYGNNLDALYDELTSLCEPISIRLLLSREEQSPMYQPGQKILRVFKDAERENENLHVIISW